MKIAHIESSLSWGGQELRTIEQAEWMIQQGHEVHIIARPDSAILAEAQKRNLPHLPLVMKGSANPKTLRRLFAYLRVNDIALLDAHSNRDAAYAMMVKLLSSIAVVRSRHVTDPIKTSHFRRWIWKYGNHRIITTADAVRQQLVEKNLATVDKIDVAIAGVCPTRFNPSREVDDLRQQLGLSKETKVIANIGMIRKDKGQKIFVQAIDPIMQANDSIANADSIHFIQVGEATPRTQGYYEDVLAAQAKLTYKNSLTFCGYHSNIEDYIALADIVVVASIGTEAQTRLVSQCFLSKTNVIATTTGGLPEMIVDGETGLLITPNDPHAIANACLTLLNDASLRSQMQQNAYEHALSHSTFDYMMEKMLNSYQTALNTAKKLPVIHSRIWE